MDSFEPITSKLRSYMEAYKPIVDGEHVETARIGTIGYGGFIEHCDTIDAVHASLEAENAELREKSIRVAEADSRWEYATKDLERVQAERDALAEALEHAYKKNRNQRKQLTEVQEAIHRRNEGELKQSWLRAKKNLECQIAQLKTCSVPLPKDANGETIFIHDWIEVDDGKRARVDAIAPNAVYWWEKDGCHWCQSFTVSLYHKPTVEDVLREMLCAWEDTPTGEGADGIIAEYAKRLTLVEDVSA